MLYNNTQSKIWLWALRGTASADRQRLPIGLTPAVRGNHLSVRSDTAPLLVDGFFAGGRPDRLSAIATNYRERLGGARPDKAEIGTPRRAHVPCRLSVCG